MIYCEKINDYVEQKEKCLSCIFYNFDEDTCTYEEWHPGLKRGKDDK